MKLLTAMGLLLCMAISLGAMKQDPEGYGFSQLHDSEQLAQEFKEVLEERYEDFRELPEEVGIREWSLMARVATLPICNTLLKKMISSGRFPMTEGPKGRHDINPLFAAGRYGALENVITLLEAGIPAHQVAAVINPSIAGARILTPLAVTIFNAEKITGIKEDRPYISERRAKIIEQLLFHGARARCVMGFTSVRETPLLYLVKCAYITPPEVEWNKTYHVLEVLCREGADVYEQTVYRGGSYSAIEVAQQRDLHEVAAMLSKKIQTRPMPFKGSGYARAEISHDNPAHVR